MNKGKRNLRQDKGSVGLSILLSVVVSLFIIGLLVFIFVVMGSNLSDNVYDVTTASVSNETLTTVTETGENLVAFSLRDVTCTLVAVKNTTGGVIMNSGNYTQTNCNLKFKAGIFNNTNWNVDYTYVHKTSNTATQTVNDTSIAISDVTDWFPIIITIAVMVALILLTVIIIVAIRGSGILAGGAGNDMGGMTA